LRVPTPRAYAVFPWSIFLKCEEIREESSLLQISPRHLFLTFSGDFTFGGGFEPFLSGLLFTCAPPQDRMSSLHLLFIIVMIYGGILIFFFLTFFIYARSTWDLKPPRPLLLITLSFIGCSFVPPLWFSLPVLSARSFGPPSSVLYFLLLF